MASGGSGHPTRHSSSEPRKKKTAYKVTNSIDGDDVASMSSALQEDRPNNWDFSDWRPSTVFDQKRMKKGNPEREREKEREREQKRDSLSVDSTPQSERKHRTPSTFPRTKISSQRLLLENLRQHLSFSDTDEGLFDGERNNERRVPSRRERPSNYAQQERNETGAVAASWPGFASGDASRISNIHREDMPDQNQIVGRLMQIRDYIKQASNMLDQIKKSGDGTEMSRAVQLEQVVLRLKEQEQKYLELLLKLTSSREDPSFYRQNSGDTAENNNHQESDSEAESLELDVQSEASEATLDHVDNGTRPRIEDKLGRHSDTDAEEAQSSQRAKRESELDNTLTPDNELDPTETELVHTRQRLESNLSKKNDELEALKEQHDLLQKMLVQQEQLRALQGQQAALLALQRDSEQRLAEERVNNEGAAAMADESGATSTSQSETEPDGEKDSEAVTDELRDLRRRLDYLKNVYDITGQAEEVQSVNTDSEFSTTSAEKAQLKDKLKDLQEKKEHMDQLLYELQSLRSSRNQLNNEVDVESMTSSQGHLQDSATAAASAGDTVAEAGQLMEVMEARKKHKKLQDIRGKLNQLRDLVQYYQSGTEFIHGKEEPEEESSVPAFSDYEDPQLMQNLRQLQRNDEINRQKQALENAEADITTEDTTQEDSSDSDSLGSSIGAWGEDPEIQEKVGKLKAAKEKLRRLQDLVSMVQASPDVARALPDNLADLTATLEGEDLILPSPNALQRHVGAGAANDPNSQFYETKMRQQQEELEQLMDERKKLLTIQDELQRLHDELPRANAIQGHSVSSSVQGTNATQTQSSEESDDRNNSATTRSAGEPAQVTFQEPLETVVSNEELYGKMRQQRILREELREKKRELEDMMRKDRPKKQYGRNQDNQSDNVSFSNKSDTFGTSLVSGDVTQATWGGSTADNLESIEEDENDSGAGQEADDDDAYPSDGIVQVEEEEEANEDSDDHDTYTIEEDYRPKGRGRKVTSPDNQKKRSRGKMHSGSAPLLSQHSPRSREYEYNFWAPGRSSSMNSNIRKAKKKQETQRHRQELPDGIGEVQTEVRNLREQLATTRSICESLVREQQAISQILQSSPPQTSNGGQYSSQLQQQQFMMNLNQSFSQLLQQQQQVTDMLRRAEEVNSGGQERGDMGRVRITSHRGNESQTYYPRTYHSGNLQFDDPSRTQQSYSSSPYVYDGSSHPQNRISFMEQQSDSEVTGYDTDSQLRLIRNENQFIGEDVMRDTGNWMPPNQTGARPKTARGRNPFSLPPDFYQMPGSSEGNKHSRRVKTEDISIETIQAADNGVPRLNLDDMVAQMHRSGIQKAQRGRPDQNQRQSQDNDEAVIGQKFPTPRRAKAAAKLASQQQVYKPGLSAGISGTAYGDGASVSSVISSVPGAEAEQGYRDIPPQYNTNSSANREIDSEATSDFSLFEALRETIYSEVATLISQNENRPHYLIELFRQLQLLNTDYLRQRSLYAVQDLVNRYLTEDKVKESKKPKKQAENNYTGGRVWLSPVAANNVSSELTPSESLVTSDDDIKAQLLARNPNLFKRLEQELKDQSSVQSSSVRSEGNFDYVENVEETSTLSTPTTDSHFDPFSQDSLGDTVIHLDKALQRMKEYERKIAQAQGAEIYEASPSNVRFGTREVRVQDDTSSSAQDQGSESSFSDVPEMFHSMSELSDSSVSGILPLTYPRIDTQQLDRQIKAIMTEVIPVLKEHMDDVCSQQLLQYIRRLVLTLTKQRDEGHEFVRFFHKQLGSILQDSMAKFEGRKMRECGEDLLVDLSEILFNELAFFRLMQDLDDPKAKAKQRIRNWHEESQTSTDVAMSQDDQEGREEEPKNQEFTEGSGSSKSASDSETEASEVERQDGEDGCIVEVIEIENDGDDEGEEDDEDEDEDDEEDDQEEKKEEEKETFSVTEEEDLGKARDDEFASRMEISDRDNDSEFGARSPVKVELSISERKSFTRIGSDEDDEEEDESHSAEDPSETAVSRDAEKEKSSEETSPQATNGPDSGANSSESSLSGEEVKDAEPNKEDGKEIDTQEHKEDGKEIDTQEQQEEAVNGNTEAQVNGEVNGSEIEEVTIDDLPPKLSNLSGDDIKTKMEEEQKDNSITDAVLAPGDQGDSELAGDPLAVKEPDDTSLLVGVISASMESPTTHNESEV